MNDVHFKSGNKEWETPDSLFQPLMKEFNIVLDTCATQSNTKCKAYLDKKINALSKEWLPLVETIDGAGATWMNPPYGRGVERWVRKAYDESFKGVTTVALLPARTDTSWFHNYIYNKNEVRFLRGRVKFVNAKSSAPFPSMIVIFKPKKENKIEKIISIIKAIWKKLK